MRTWSELIPFLHKVEFSIFSGPKFDGKFASAAATLLHELKTFVSSKAKDSDYVRMEIFVDQTV